MGGFMGTLFVSFLGVTVFLFCLSYFNRVSNSKEGFFVANRNIGFLESSFSIAASWVWAPALFVSSQQAYQHGWLGLFWFTVPNFLCLILFSFFAKRLRSEFREGFTLSEYIKTVYSNRVQSLYWFTLSGLAVCAFAVQLLAGGKLIESVFNVPFFFASITMAIVPLSYSWFFGLKSSIFTDYVKMVIVLTIGAGILVSLFGTSVSLETVLNGLSGVNKTHGSFFSQENLLLFLTFGLPVSIGLLSAPFGDQSMWQRVFSTKEQDVKRSFIFGAFIFVLVPLMIGSIGLAAAGSSFQTQASMVGLNFLTNTLGIVGTVLFSTLALSALTSIIDSKLLSFASIASVDVLDRINRSEYLTTARLAMLVLVVIGVAIANIPGMQILYLFLFYGTLRSATLIPTILAILKKRVPEASVFYGVLLGIFLGLPTFVFGNLTKTPLLIVSGSLITILVPGIAIIYGKFRGENSSIINSQSAR